LTKKRCSELKGDGSRVTVEEEERERSDKTSCKSALVVAETHAADDVVEYCNRGHGIEGRWWRVLKRETSR
jgi:hypothetical protein